MKTMLLAAVLLGIAACGGTTDPATGLWSFQIGDDSHQSGIVVLNENGTGRATNDQFGTCFMCGPVKWERDGNSLRIDFYTVNTNFNSHSLEYSDVGQQLDTLTGTFHASGSMDGKVFTANRF